MSEGLPHHQHISGVSTQNHSQAFVGSARDVYFSGSKNPQEVLEQAANACRNALFLTDPHVDRESIISAKGKRVTGTCEWIVYNKSYRTWVNGDHDSDGNNNTRLLWVSGGPGKGKTMLSVFLTEELERHTARIDNSELSFFFCSHQDEKRNTAEAVLRSLVYQIVSKRTQLVKHVLPYFETPTRAQQTLTSCETLCIIFKKLIEDPDFGTMFCVLDGLDECEEGALQALVPRLVDLLSDGAANVTTTSFRLAIVSREISGLQGCVRIKLDPDNNEQVASDIERFISTRVGELTRIEGFSEAFRAAVQKRLLARAEGTFLWVGFAMHELQHKQTCTQVLQALEALPSGLPAIYSRMLLQIPSDERQTSSSILRWVTIAVRPLKLQELAVVVGIHESPQLITAERAIRDKIALCGPFLKIQKQTVSLVHQSAQDYLLRKERHSNDVLEQFRIEIHNAHLELARACLDCISKSCLQYKPLNLDNKGYSQESLLLQYAVLYWPEHARACSTLAAELFSASAPFFQAKSDLRKNWWAAYKAAKKMDGPSTLPILHLACQLGVVPWIEATLARERWKPWANKLVNKKGELGETPLHWAVWGSHESVVQLLIEKGADVNIEDRDGGTALQLAATGKAEAVVRLLLNNGAKVNVKSDNGKTALHRAASKAHEEVVRLLIDRGADINAKNKDGETALHLAASEEGDSVVRLLLNNRADVKAKSNDGKTALHLATSCGNEAVVRMLVNSGADVEAKNSDGKTALHLAMKRGNEAVARLLIKSGADMEVTDLDGRTALQWAAWARNEAVVQLLIDRGANTIARDGFGKTALHLAAWGGGERVVQILVENGLDVKMRDDAGTTALQWAAWGRNALVVQQLIDYGADVRAVDEDGETALHWAAWGGDEVTVQLLIASGADVPAKDKCGMTALHLATRSGNEAVMKLLLARGADINAMDNDGKTILHSAAWEGDDTGLQLLIDSGAHLDAKDHFGATMLHWAAAAGNEAVIGFLLEKGADIEAKDATGKTALHSAASAWRNKVEIVRVFLDGGADVNATDDDGETVLHWAAEGENEAVVRLLVDRGANIKAKANNRGTVLHWAAMQGNEAVVRLLVEGGADVKAKDIDGGTVLQWAAEGGNEQVMKLLIDRGAVL